MVVLKAVCGAAWALAVGDADHKKWLKVEWGWSWGLALG